MSEPEINEFFNDVLTDTALTDREVNLAVRSAVTFLASCVDGKVSDASVSDRILAARSVLEYAARRPDMLADLVNSASMLSDEDLAVVATVLE